MTTANHDRRLALRLMQPGEDSLSEDEAIACFDAMTWPEKGRVGQRFEWIKAAFERPIGAWVQAVQDEVCAIAANLPPDIGGDVG